MHFVVYSGLIFAFYTSGLPGRTLTKLSSSGIDGGKYILLCCNQELSRCLGMTFKEGKTHLTNKLLSPERKVANTMFSKLLRHVLP